MQQAPTQGAAHDLGPLEAISDAVEAGLGLPEVVRAAARALDASLVLIDRTSAVLAVAARSPAEERAMMENASGVEQIDLRVGDVTVGRLRLRPRGTAGPSPLLLKLATTLIASEVERIRAPERASAAAQESFLAALLRRQVTDRGDIVARGAELGLDLSEGAAIAVVRTHRFSGAEDDWRGRLVAVCERAARAVASRSIAAPAPIGPPEQPGQAQVVVLIAESDPAEVRRTIGTMSRELQSGLPGCTFMVGFSRVAVDPVDLYRAGHEALLAANVASVPAHDEAPSVLSFEDTGAYRILLPAMSEDPQELQRFYAETVEPLVVYDEQYETDLVTTLETFLDCDGNVAGTAARLFTHRHTIRYRLERVKELSGLDVSSTDGRENLGLGLKAMRVLGVAVPRGPADEAGTGAGRVPSRNDDR